MYMPADEGEPATMTPHTPYEGLDPNRVTLTNIKHQYCATHTVHYGTLKCQLSYQLCHWHELPRTQFGVIWRCTMFSPCNSLSMICQLQHFILSLQFSLLPTLTCATLSHVWSMFWPSPFGSHPQEWDQGLKLVSFAECLSSTSSVRLGVDTVDGWPREGSYKTCVFVCAMLLLCGVEWKQCSWRNAEWFINISLNFPIAGKICLLHWGL